MGQLDEAEVWLPDGARGSWRSLGMLASFSVDEGQDGECGASQGDDGDDEEAESGGEVVVVDGFGPACCRDRSRSFPE